MLNEETLNQKLIEETANDTKWASTIEPVFKKCIAAGNFRQVDFIRLTEIFRDSIFVQ